MRPAGAPGLERGPDPAPLQQALERSLAGLARLPAGVTFRFGRELVPLARMQETLLDFRDNLARYGLTAELDACLRAHYRFFRSAASSVLYTGYYEPTLRGSLRQSERYAWPLYGRPDDMVLVDLSQYPFFSRHPGLPRQIRGRLTPEKRVLPYWTRTEIEGGKLAGRGLEIVWIDDPLDVFFLHIQGSGRVLLDDGSEMRVGYAEQNGHPFRAIGRELIERGAMSREEASMEAIRAWLNAHPDEMSAVLNANPSYIFFRDTPEGPVGSSGVTVTGGRSIATDSRLFPAHALCLAVTEEPLVDGSAVTWAPLRRFVLNQDTGGAIRGADRVDLFFGSGDEAGRRAGVMRRPGALYFLLKNGGR